MSKSFKKFGIGNLLALIVMFSAISYCQAGTDLVFFVQDNLLEGVSIEAAKLGDTMPIATFKQKAKDYNHSVIIGKIYESHIAALLKERKVTIDNGWLGDQGFQIHSWKDGENTITLVTGVTDVGVLYGLLDLPLQTEYLGFNTVGEYLDSLPQKRDRPFFELRRGLLQDRANFIIIGGYGWPFDYSPWPEIYENEEQRLAILEKDKDRIVDFEKTYAEAKKYGARIFIWVYEPTFPVYSERFFKKYPEADARDNGGHLNPSAEIVKTIQREKYRLYFKKYPLLGGVYLSFKNGGPSYLTPSLACKATHDPYKEAKEVIATIESGMREINPEATVIVRQWAMGKAGLELIKLSNMMPSSIRYGCKSTCPPGNDYMWNDLFTPYLKKVPGLMINGLTSYNTDAPSDITSQLCYDAPKLKIRALEFAKYSNYGAWEGDLRAIQRAKYYSPEILLLNEPARRARAHIGWDPFSFDPNTLLSSYGKRMFGEKAGNHFFLAMKDIWKVTDAMVFKPEWTSGRARTGNLHFYQFFTWKKTGYNTGIQQPEEFASITADKPEFEKFYKRFDIADAEELAERAVCELEKALKGHPANADSLLVYHEAAKTTLALMRAWRDYHLGLLCHTAAKNALVRDENSSKLRQKSIAYMTTALSEMWKYRDGFFKIYPKLKKDIEFYYGKSPKMYLAIVTQEIQDGYNNVILKPKLEAFKPIWYLSSHKEKVPEYSEPEITPTTLPKTIFIKDISDGQLAPLISLNVLPELNLVFEADLSNGGMLKIAERPWRIMVPTIRGFGIANVEILLNGEHVGFICEYGEGWTELLVTSFIRYIELPSTDKKTHTLRLRSKGRTGMRLDEIGLYAKGQLLSAKTPQNITYDFSDNPQWQKDQSNNSQMKMYHDKQNGKLVFDLWRESGEYSMLYHPLPGVWAGHICCEFDFTIDKATPKSWGTIGLFSEFGRGDAGGLVLTLFAKSPTAIKISGSDIELKTKQKYHVKMQRTTDTLSIIITEDYADGKAVMNEVKTAFYMYRKGFDSFGVTNKRPSSKTAGPMKIVLDNVSIKFGPM